MNTKKQAALLDNCLKQVAMCDFQTEDGMHELKHNDAFQKFIEFSKHNYVQNPNDPDDETCTACGQNVRSSVHKRIK